MKLRYFWSNSENGGKFGRLVLGSDIGLSRALCIPDDDDGHHGLRRVLHLKDK